VMGLTPAALATSVNVVRPLERRLESGLAGWEGVGKGFPSMLEARKWLG
jgi:hypothetical protein